MEIETLLQCRGRVDAAPLEVIPLVGCLLPRSILHIDNVGGVVGRHAGGDGRRCLVFVLAQQVELSAIEWVAGAEIEALLFFSFFVMWGG